MSAPSELWWQELRRQALRTSPDMHDHFAFLERNGWFEGVVDTMLNQALEFLLMDLDLQQPNQVEDVKLRLGRGNAERVGNAVFRFVMNDTLERNGAPAAGPVHWVTYSYFWFRWREAAPDRMRDLLAGLPVFIHG